MTVWQRFPRLARVRDRWSRAAVVMYHRVATPANDPWALSVSSEHFAEHLDQYRRHRTVLPMDTFVDCIRRDRLPRDAVAITFDDGYLDNLVSALPILIDANVPATLFLSTGPTLRGELYWDAEIEAMILDAVEPVHFEIVLPDGPLRIDFGERWEADYDRRGWRAWTPPRTPREAAFVETWERLRPLHPRDRMTAMAQLRQTLPAVLSAGTRALTPAEVCELTASGHVTLGGHTVDHPDLPALDHGDALDEIARGKADVETILGRPIAGFAYPFGRLDSRVRACAEAAGFAWACSTEPSFVGATRSDRFAIPRLAVPDSNDVSFLKN
jgi:peptidoglycan/xylan/chitin deacetylase (PgdA/CDA1 family)